MTRTRLTTRPFPSYAHRPGVTVHPNQPGGHQHGQTEALASPLLAGGYATHYLYRFGLDLLNHGYFWESHVAFEAIWNAHQRVGDQAQMLKALIKLAAAGVKAHHNTASAALGHLTRAIELIQNVDPIIISDVFGLEKQLLLRQIEELQLGPPFLNEENCFSFELIPRTE